MDNTQILFGLRILKDSNCTRDTNKPAKIHTKKSNPAYHKRIQKKWIKRFGMEREYTSYKFGNTLVCHPAIYDKLINEFRSAKNN